MVEFIDQFRNSAREFVDDSDVIFKLDLLKKGVNAIGVEATEAKQIATNASASVGQYNDRIVRAETNANTALTAARNAETIASEAESSADAAGAKADNAFVSFNFQYDSSGVMLNQTKGSGELVQQALPVASNAQSGIMNAQTYAGIDNLNQRVAALEGRAQTYYVTLPSQNPSQTEITSAVTVAKGSAPVQGDYAEDIARNLRYGYNGTEWILVQGITAGNFTNTSAGLIKGSTADGQVFAEVDGTGSINGWDAVKAHADTYGSKVDVLEGQMTTANADIVTLKTSVVTAQSTADSANTLAGQANTKATDNASAIASMQTTVEQNTTDIASLRSSKQDSLTGTSVQLPVSGWNTASLTQTVTVTGVTVSSLIWVAPDGGSFTAWGESGVYASAQGTDTITFTCTTIPTGILTANIIIG